MKIYLSGDNPEQRQMVHWGERQVGSWTCFSLDKLVMRSFEAMTQVWGFLHIKREHGWPG